MFELISGTKRLSLASPVVMGILNVTPDSFSDGGKFSSFELACQHADEMVAQGALIIDIGGESTRPGAADVGVEDELARVIPLVEYVAKHHDVWISVDTSKPEVMRQAVNAGAHLINDVRALLEPGALETAAQLNVPICLMHMQGAPRTMQAAPEYHDLVADVSEFLNERIQACLEAGIPRERLLIDPGFGFGKTLAHNYELLAKLETFTQFELPILIGLSRKSMIGNLLARPTSERLAGSLAGAMIAAQKGAHIIRVHDVPETVDMLKVLQATQAYY
ncbi:dihydropteroate synthase [Shewanella oneidensis MR-1]|uniref:Dihydropteroate synthase n=1 Tax=Shewanella oneidensis (strain ATCC 700550 / JCM 31522 / CIP 106686 / LMG 19005 / NCIMB 14063 / MR-1) TaxID=211586 RepID=Q8EHM1_SHEON|nr:dihydropteroate synthase [Shewanella oneidensis]AAN54268.1 dihydropteroate synthase FolP [Shewanella oneidensis MR-1]MDX5996947.1 dihydropteroate synthase [Shewanella oneidensis]MEE2028218.1 Dihydropteroate synthase [Shewanella oneidensis]QKG95985.1 dihydropteroate synthase [Shewanella oneidensis MR-1]